MVSQQPFQNPFIKDQRVQGAEVQDNENQGFVCCQECCGNVINTVCFPCCLICGCNRITIHQGSAGLMLRNGRFHKSLPPGIYLINTCLYTVTIISVKSRLVRQHRAELITRDTLTVYIDFFVVYEIRDPYTAVRGLQMADQAILTIAGGRLKNLVSSYKLEQLLHSSHFVNETLKEDLQGELGSVGININSAEIISIAVNTSKMLELAQVAISEKDKTAQINIAESNLKASKFTNEAAAILKDNQSSMNLQFFETLKNISKTWNETIIAADGMLYIPRNNKANK